jgi:hypothetical protein
MFMTTSLAMFHREHSPMHVGNKRARGLFPVLEASALPSDSGTAAYACGRTFSFAVFAEPSRLVSVFTALISSNPCSIHCTPPSDDICSCLHTPSLLRDRTRDLGGR